jgi:hypothetical protein
MNGVLPFSAGGLLVAGWFIFFDAVMMRQGGPPLEITHYVPGFIGTMALLMAMVAPYRALVRDDSMSSGVTPAKQCARLWMFGTMLAVLTSLYAAGGLAVLIHSSENLRFGGGSVVDKSHRWLGSALVGQATCLAASTSLWMLRRLQVTAERVSSWSF